MVSILPSERTPFDVISKDVGRALQGVLPGAVQQGYQRGQGLGAIDQLQQAMEAAGGDINKILPALAKAYTMNPSLERSGLGQQYLQQAGAGQQAAGLAGMGGQSQNTQQPQQQQNAPQTQGIQEDSIPPKSQGEVKEAKDIDIASNNFLAQLRPDLVNPSSQYGAINSFDSAIKKDLSPEEEGQIRQQLLDKKTPAGVVDKIVDRLRQGIQNKYQEAQDKYGFDQDKLNQIQNKWKTFTGNADDRLAPTFTKYRPEGEILFPKTEDLLKSKYFQYGGAESTNLTPEQMHTNAMAKLDNDIKRLDALDAIPSMPPIHSFGGAKDYIDQVKPAYKALAKEGFTEALKEDALLKKDMGNEEFHEVIWGDQTNKGLLNQIHSLKAPKEFKQAPYPHYNRNFEKEQKEYMNNLTNTLMKLKPDDDLILARAMVLDNGGDIKDFTSSLDEAQKKGLKLSPLQQSQLQEIHIPRRPPLWEIFSGATGDINPLGLVGNLNWKPFINYVRGKK